MKESISRRNFLKGALATGTVVAGAGLVGCASGGADQSAKADTAGAGAGAPSRVAGVGL